MHPFEVEHQSHVAERRWMVIFLGTRAYLSHCLLPFLCYAAKLLGQLASLEELRKRHVYNHLWRTHGAEDPSELCQELPPGTRTTFGDVEV